MKLFGTHARDCQTLSRFRQGKLLKRSCRLMIACALLIPAFAPRAGGNDGSGSIAEGASGISDHGYTPNTAITSVAGIEVNQKTMDLMFSLPVAPEFKVGGGIGYSVSTRYDSNLVSYLPSTPDPDTTSCSNGFPGYSCTTAAKTGGAYIPTYKSPFGVGFEFGFGVVYKALNGAGQLDSRLYGWMYRSPDGSTHALHLMKTMAPSSVTQQCNGQACWNSFTFYDPVPAPGDTQVSHLFWGDTVGFANGTAFIEHGNPAWEYATADGSLIRAKASYGADGKVNRWDLWFPDGRHAIFDHPYGNPDAGYFDAGASFQRRNAPPVCPPPANQPVEVCRPDIENRDPQEMIGFYPTRVENRSRVGFNLAYDATYGYLVNAIRDDSDRTGSVTMTIGTSGAAAGRYTAIRYPGPNGSPLTVTLEYDTAEMALRGIGGNRLNLNGPLDTAHPAPPVVITRLRSVTQPGGYKERFEYYDETAASGTSLCGDGVPAADDNALASGKIARILTPGGAVHRFVYKQFPNHTLTDTNPQSDKYPNEPHVGICAHHLDVNDPGPAPRRLGGADHQRWLYRQEDVYIASTFPHNMEIKHYDTLNIADDPGDNSTTYYFYESAVGGGGRSKGLLADTRYYQGKYGGGGVLKKQVINFWAAFGGLPEPEERESHKIVKTETRLYDDLVNGQPGTLVEENLNWDDWGHFTTRRTSGTLMPKVRQTVTRYSGDKSKIQFDAFREPGGDARGYYETTWSESIDASVMVPIYFPLYSAHPSAPNCAYINSLIAATPDANGNLPWFPSLPLSVETQEQAGTDSLGNPIFSTRARSETRYDAATGLPVRTIARKNPSASASDECSAALAPAAGDLVSDFYYDARGNLALTKSSGGDDNSVFRKFSGTGDAPAASEPPTAPAAVGPDANELIYPDPGSYFGYSRWSRAFTGDSAHGGEGPSHQFLDGVIARAGIEPASGAVLESVDANGLKTAHGYDAIGRLASNQFLGDGTNPDAPVRYRYHDVPGANGAVRLIGLETLQDDPADPGQKVHLQDYFDGLGRKVIARRRNPDGQYAYQVTHYDVMGHPDLLGNWSFTAPPGLAENTAGDPLLDPSQWNDAELGRYLATSASGYTRNCFRTYSPGAHGGACERAGDAAADSGAYEFAGRPRRVERVDAGGALISAVDTYYFGLSVKTVVHGIKTGAAAAEDRTTIHYKDGYGNLRVVDEDVRPDGSAGQGVDAIYDYDYAGHLVKVNLVPQAHLSPFAAGGDRFATRDADHQVRTFVFDTLGRQVETNNPETGTVRTLAFNALGAALETEDENGRIGGGPGGGAFTETVAPLPNRGCNRLGCPMPTLISNGILVKGGRMSAAWSATGVDAFGRVEGARLYFRLSLDGAVMNGWTPGLLNWSREGVPAGGHTFVVEATYADNLIELNPALIASLSQAFTEATNAEAYHLLTLYDGRGRATAVIKRRLADGAKSALRQTFYEGDGTDCTRTASCGKVVQALAYQPLGTAGQSLSYDPATGRASGQTGGAPALSGQRSDTIQFHYDRFGRQDRATYPNGKVVALRFQAGGVVAVNAIDAASGALTPYARLGAAGDYHPDGSLAHFVQGNAVEFIRSIDEAERVQSIEYDKIIPPCPKGQICPAMPNVTRWASGLYQYDGAGDIVAIGSDSFTYDRMARLTNATLNRHPHDTFANGPQPAGFVTLAYAYDAFGNITGRQLPAHLGYTVGLNPLELFGGRDYTPGVSAAPDNQIHAPGFLYDGNGNLVSDGVKDYLYDELNQQVEVRQVNAACAAGLSAGQPAPGPNANYRAGQAQIKNQLVNGLVAANVSCYGTGNLVEKNAYGADGMRAAREVYDPVTGAPKRTTYARLAGSAVSETTEEFRTATSPAPEGSHGKTYIYGPLGLLATEERCEFNCKSDESAGANVTRYYEYDHLGTVRAITNSSGNLETTFDYEPFGLELKSADARFAWWTDTSSNTHKFTGHERDEEAGEDYMKARMYVLSTARFPQIDPVFSGAGDPQNWNPYIYVLNSPVGASDPTGTQTLNEPDEAKGAFAGGGGKGFSDMELPFTPKSASPDKPADTNAKTVMVGSSAPPVVPAPGALPKNPTDSGIAFGTPNVLPSWVPGATSSELSVAVSIGVCQPATTVVVASAAIKAESIPASTVTEGVNTGENHNTDSRNGNSVNGGFNLGVEGTVSEKGSLNPAGVGGELNSTQGVRVGAAIGVSSDRSYGASNGRQSGNSRAVSRPNSSAAINKTSTGVVADGNGNCIVYAKFTITAAVKNGVPQPIPSRGEVDIGVQTLNPLGNSSITVPVSLHGDHK